MKKKLLLLLSGFMLLAVLALSEAFAEVLAGGYEVENGVLKAYTGTSASIEIPADVVTIGENVFAKKQFIKEITIPASVRTIGTSAFEDCKNLNTVRVESLEAWLALECSDCYANPNYYATKFYVMNEDKTYGTELTDLVIPEVDHIRDYAFRGFSAIANVTIPNTVEWIGDFAFQECKKITSVILPNSVVEIGYCSFAKCSALKTVVLSESMTEIAEDAFLRCFNLNSINFPEGLEVIGAQAFAECCLLPDPAFPSSLRSIGSCAFYNGSWLTEKNQPGKIKNLVIPEGVETIGDLAFAYCGAIEKISLPSTLTYLGDGAFMSCIGLKEPVTIPSGITEITAELFADCKNLTGINLPDGLLRINNNFVMGCESLENLEIPISVFQIEKGAFDDCEGLVPVTACASSADRCLSWYGVEHTICHEPEPIPEGGSCTRCGLSFNESMQYEIPDLSTAPALRVNVKTIEPHTFEGTAVECVVIKRGCTSIGSGAFRNCEKMKYVSIPYTVKRIAADAFENDDFIMICDYADSAAWNYASKNGICTVMK